jgi:hypothetical protein
VFDRIVMTGTTGESLVLTEEIVMVLLKRPKPKQSAEIARELGMNRFLVVTSHCDKPIQLGIPSPRTAAKARRGVQQSGRSSLPTPRASRRCALSSVQGR